MAISAVSACAEAQATDLNQYRNHLQGAACQTEAWHLRVSSSNNAQITLSDAGGSQDFRINDSGGTRVFDVDSDGNTALSGTLTVTGNTILTADLQVNGGCVGLSGDTDLLGLAASTFTVRGQADIEGYVSVGNGAALDDDVTLLVDRDFTADACTSPSVISIPAQTITEAGSGTHARITGLSIVAPTIGGAGGAVTNTASLYVSAAPCASGATDYALWLDAGNARFDGGIMLDGGGCIGTSADPNLIGLADCAVAIVGTLDVSSTIQAGSSNITLTTSAGLLKHEAGGIELDISSIGVGDVLAGASAGAIEIVDGGSACDGDVLTIQSDGTANYETPGGGPSQASQAALEAETDEDTYAPPDLIKHSPGVAKGYCTIASDGTLQANSFNVDSTARDGTGDYAITWDVDFANTNYVVQMTGEPGSSAGENNVEPPAAGTVTIRTMNSGGVAADVATHTVAFGDQ